MFQILSKNELLVLHVTYLISSALNKDKLHVLESLLLVEVKMCRNTHQPITKKINRTCWNITYKCYSMMIGAAPGQLGALK